MLRDPVPVAVAGKLGETRPGLPARRTPDVAAPGYYFPRHYNGDMVLPVRGLRGNSAQPDVNPWSHTALPLGSKSLYRLVFALAAAYNLRLCVMEGNDPVWWFPFGMFLWQTSRRSRV